MSNAIIRNKLIYLAIVVMVLLSACGGKEECEAGNYSMGYGIGSDTASNSARYSGSVRPDSDKTFESVAIAFHYSTRMGNLLSSNDFVRVFNLNDKEFKETKDLLEEKFDTKDDVPEFAGMGLNDYWMIGFPGEDGDQLEATLTFSKQAEDLDEIVVYAVEIYDECYRVSEHDFNK